VFDDCCDEAADRVLFGNDLDVEPRPASRLRCGQADAGDDGVVRNLEPTKFDEPSRRGRTRERHDVQTRWRNVGQGYPWRRRYNLIDRPRDAMPSRRLRLISARPGSSTAVPSSGPGSSSASAATV